MGNGSNRIVRWAKMGVEWTSWCYDTIRESGSEELNYVIDIITQGYRPGTIIKEGQRDGEKDNRD